MIGTILRFVLVKYILLDGFGGFLYTLNKMLVILKKWLSMECTGHLIFIAVIQTK